MWYLRVFLLPVCGLCQSLYSAWTCPRFLVCHYNAGLVDDLLHDSVLKSRHLSNALVVFHSPFESASWLQGRSEPTHEVERGRLPNSSWYTSSTRIKWHFNSSPPGRGWGDEEVRVQGIYTHLELDPVHNSFNPWYSHWVCPVSYYWGVFVYVLVHVRNTYMYVLQNVSI